MKIFSLLLLSAPTLLFAKLLPYDFSSQNPFAVSPGSSTTAKGENPFKDVEYKSGYVNIGRMGGEMFYWMFPNSEGKTAMDTPFIIWLTGGPGCSSELAALTENGPLTVNPNGDVTHNLFSWNKASDVVYVDQPLGTGFSSVGDPRNYVTNEETVATDIREFLIKFLDLYPTLKNKPFYLTGESYAGHYIPSIAHELINNPVLELNLVGMAIGNGWVDPSMQYPMYADFAFEHNMVGEAGYQLAKRAYGQCLEFIHKGMWPVALVHCNAITNGLLGKKNPYDVRLDCETPPMCYNMTSLDNLMNTEEAQHALGVHKKWKQCDPIVYALMMGDWVVETRTKVAEVVEAGLKVLIYSGDQDFICNWRGGQAWVNNVEWAKQDEFVNKKAEIWNVNGKPAGEVRTVDNLTFLRVFDAGHMVPMDQPEAALAMLEEFLGVKEAPKSVVQKDFDFLTPALVAIA